MRPTKQTEDSEETLDVQEPETPPFDRGYLTDGRDLFHIERTLVDNPRGELLVELEDCTTLELIVCAARSIPDLGMRPVRPLPLPTS
jgi:hypothetical protein